MRFELWLVDERGILSKPRGDAGDHQGFAKSYSIRGWARIEPRSVLLLRSDKATDVPGNVKDFYQLRFPGKKIEDRIDLHRRIEEADLNRVERKIRRKERRK